MQLHKISVKNFRLLHDVEVLLEPRTTVIVGRNNCGKTSLTEVVKRLLHDKTAVFRLEDFAFCCHNKFWEAFLAFKNAAEEQDVRLLLPSIEIKLSFTYGPADPLGLLSEFVIDLDPDCSEAVVVGRYTLKPAMMTSLFANLEDTEATGKDELFRLLRERIPNLFGLDLFAVDPNDATNTKAIELSLLRSLAASGFISAQRGLDDESKEDRVVIGKVLENLFMTAKNNPADAASHEMAKELEGAVHEIQDKIGTDFNSKLNALMPALSLFGHYPTAGDSTLLTETTLNVDKLLTNHTRVRYSGVNGIHLPEAYNGLGARNIILILLQLRQFFKQCWPWSRSRRFRSSSLKNPKFIFIRRCRKCSSGSYRKSQISSERSISSCGRLNSLFRPTRHMSPMRPDLTPSAIFWRNLTRNMDH